MALTGVRARPAEKIRGRQAVAPGQLIHEVAQQERDFLFALAQGGHMHGECAQTVVKIFAQFPFGDRLLQMLTCVAARMRTSISIAILAARPDKISVPQDVQQLGLQAHRHFGDLVEQQRAPLAKFEFAGLGVRPFAGRCRRARSPAHRPARSRN